jgi:hypothetical protein
MQTKIRLELGYKSQFFRNFPTGSNLIPVASLEKTTARFRRCDCLPSVRPLAARLLSVCNPMLLPSLFPKGIGVLTTSKTGIGAHIKHYTLHWISATSTFKARGNSTGFPKNGILRILHYTSTETNNSIKLLSQYVYFCLNIKFNAF